VNAAASPINVSVEAVSASVVNGSHVISGVAVTASGVAGPIQPGQVL
jgi:hypothetical protein